MNKDEKKYPTMLEVLSKFSILEILSLYKLFFGLNIIIGFMALIFIVVGGGMNIFGLTEISNSLENDFAIYVNQFTPYFFGGKIFLWATIFYIIFLIIIKFDEDYFRNFSITIPFPVLSVPKLIGLTFLLLGGGFILGAFPFWIVFWVFWLCTMMMQMLPDNPTFKKVYDREWPNINEDDKN